MLGSGVLKVWKWNELTPAERTALLERPAAARAMFSAELDREITSLVQDVRSRGDEAVIDATRRFDGCDVAPSEVRVSDTEIQAAKGVLADDLKEAIKVAIKHSIAFNEAASERGRWEREIVPGLIVGEQVTPIESAGLFVPGGKGSFPSSLVQIGAPAVVAGVHRPAVLVPPLPGGNHRVDPGVLFAADQLGLREIYCANGPAGIAALAFGTQSIPRVAKIVGPGSPPVVAAQLICERFGCVTQQLLGPTESMVIADRSADLPTLAIDLVSEAEHGPDSTTWLVTDDAGLIEELDGMIAEALAHLPSPRREYASQVFHANGGAILVRTFMEAVEVADSFAPEHLQLAVSAPRDLLGEIRHAGEIILGQAAGFSMSNYVLGVPAALPTGGSAKACSGVTAATFQKSAAYLSLEPRTAERLARPTAALARHEGFPAHASAAEMRLQTATPFLRPVDVSL